MRDDPNQYDPAFVDEIKRADAAPSEVAFDNVEDMMQHLNSDNLVELVANVIREQQGCFFDDVARHVLVAVATAGYVIVPREPTEAMIDAGAIYADHNGAHGAWQAMIDCALKEDA